MPPAPHPSRRWRIAPLIGGLALFTIVAAALLTAVGLIYRTVEAERRARAEAQRSDAVLAAINDVGRAALNAETGQRGYFITLDRGYLASYQFGAARYPLAMARLERLAARAGNARERRLVAEVRSLADTKFAEMGRSVAQIEQGRVLDAQVGILGDQGQRAMTRLRAALAELEAGQRRALRATLAETAALEARLAPLLAGLLAMIGLALALGLALVVRMARAEAGAAHAEALRAARDRADLLARELNHRVKNLFAVVLAIVRMSGKDAPAAEPVVAKIDQRIRALAIAHEATKGDLDRPEVDLRKLVETVIAPHRSNDAACTIEGDSLPLPARLAAPLGLVLHELTTNAVKYGAWSAPGGSVAVRWRRRDGEVALTWRETGAGRIAASAAKGFGSQLIDSSARQLGGSVARTFHPDGIEVQMNFPA